MPVKQRRDAPGPTCPNVANQRSRAWIDQLVCGAFPDSKTPDYNCGFNATIIWTNRAYELDAGSRYESGVVGLAEGTTNQLINPGT